MKKQTSKFKLFLVNTGVRRQKKWRNRHRKEKEKRESKSELSKTAGRHFKSLLF